MIKPGRRFLISYAIGRTNTTLSLYREKLEPIVISRLWWARRRCTPSNWSDEEWNRELRQIAAVEALQASLDYDDAEESESLEKFVSRRVESALRRAQRRETAYFWRFAQPMNEGAADSARSLGNGARREYDQQVSEDVQGYKELREAVSGLSRPHQRVVVGLFIEGQTEEDLAKEFRIGRRAINKRKQKALSLLRGSY